MVDEYRCALIPLVDSALPGCAHSCTRRRHRVTFTRAWNGRHAGRSRVTQDHQSGGRVVPPLILGLRTDLFVGRGEQLLRLGQ